MLFHLWDAFRAGDVWLALSRRYGDIRKALLVDFRRPRDVASSTAKRWRFSTPICPVALAAEHSREADSSRLRGEGPGR